MKTILTTIPALVVLASTATAQKIEIVPASKKQAPVQAQSFASSVTGDSLNVLWLKDGLDTNYTALSYPLFNVNGLGNRVQIVALGAFDSNFSKTNMYLGTGVSVSVLRNSGWDVKAYAGFKGFNLGQNFSRTEGAEGFVWGLGLTIPVK
jgi:hypothetical protein